MPRRHPLLSPALPLLVAACIAPFPVQEGEGFGDHAAPPFPGRLDALIGVRQLEDDGVWDPVDEQAHIAVELAVGDPEGPLQGQFGLHYGWDDATRTDALGERVHLDHFTWEVSAGVLKVVRIPGVMLRPYAGVGASFMNVHAHLLSGGVRIGENDFGVGLYVRGGLLVEFAPGRYAGIDVRHLTGTDIDIEGLADDADATLYSLVFGYSF